MPWIYILRCSDGSYYTGSTSDPERRLAEHQSGIEGSYTCNKRPVEMAYCEEFPSFSDAVEREMQIKGWGRKKKRSLN